MDNKLTWWVRDAANSICGQTGAKAHQEKLHEAADELDRLSARLMECESALSRWDDGQDSEYWLRHPTCRAAELEPSK